MAVLIMLTGFSMHHLSIGAAISKRTKSNASTCSRCLRWKCRLPLTARCVHGGCATIRSQPSASTSSTGCCRCHCGSASHSSRSQLHASCPRCEMHRGRGRCIHKQLRRALREQRRKRSLQLDGRGSSDHGSLQLAVFGRRLAAGLGFGGVLSVESILGGFLGGFGLADLLEGHGSRFGVRLSSAVPKSYTMCSHAQPCRSYSVTLSQPCADRRVPPILACSRVAALARGGLLGRWLCLARGAWLPQSPATHPQPVAAPGALVVQIHARSRGIPARC
jgi:hypothetical protein